MTDEEFQAKATELFNECTEDQQRLRLIFNFVVNLSCVVRRGLFNVDSTGRGINE